MDDDPDNNNQDLQKLFQLLSHEDSDDHPDFKFLTNEEAFRLLEQR